MRSLLLGLIFTATALATVTLVGCNQSSSTPRPQNQPQQQAAAPATIPVPAAHAHDKPGSHGGLISPIGTENYHVEAVFEKEGIVKLYVLGKDEARVQEVESQSLEAYVKPMDGMEATQVDFQAVPQKGDTQGKTSRFIGKLPPELRGKAVTGTVPSITISGERFRFSFASGQSHEDPMPQQVSAEQARELYLTPGGKYTQADIEANGTMTAPQKYEGFRASHNIKPSKGDKVCPVTLTKANPKCTWIVGGNTYEFCCPPCIDEFMELAKQKPDEVKAPEVYLKK